jgi:hypothetical protein
MAETRSEDPLAQLVRAVRREPNYSAYKLADLEEQVFEEIVKARRAGQTAMQHARQAGHMLIEIKRRLKHGQWDDWKEKHWGDRDPTTLRLYMRIAEHWEWLSTAKPAKRDGDPDLPMSITEARRLLRRAGADEEIDVDVDAKYRDQLAKSRRTRMARWRRAERDVTALLATRRGLTADQILAVVARALGLRRPRSLDHS